jgi:hypothetical protein
MEDGVEHVEKGNRYRRVWWQFKCGFLLIQAPWIYYLYTFGNYQLKHIEHVSIDLVGKVGL